MAFVPALNVVRVFLEHTLNNKPGVGWVLHFETSLSPWTTAQMADLGSELVTWWNTSMRPLMSTGVALNRIRMREMSSQSSLVADYDTGLPILGSRAGTDLPANIAFCLKFGTGLAGKSFRGRVYQFGMVEADVSVNNVSSAYALSVRTAWTNGLLHVGALADYGLVVCSFQTLGQPRVTAEVTPVTNVSYVDLRVDTQRRRLTKGGA